MKISLGTIAAAFIFITALPVPSGAYIGVDEEEVVFRLRSPGAGNVFLVGDFNGWNPTIDRMMPKKGAHEISLFLLPGRYRYMFIVDGVSMPDPDNPNRDEDGNSYFIFRETLGGYEVVFSGEGGMVRLAEETERIVSGEALVVTGEDEGSIFLLGNVRGVAGERAEADLAVGFEYEAQETGSGVGRSGFLSGSAAYRMDNGIVKAFNRSDVLDLDDPLAVFGTVSPFDYPIGVFCRGITYEGGFARRFKGKVFYAGRIEGFRTGLEEAAAQYPGAESLFAKRDLTDSDIIGVRLGGEFGGLGINYLCRRDDRPGDRTWTLSRSGGGAYYRGFERVLFDGVWISLDGEGDFKLDAEYLKGRSYLLSLERSSGDTGEFENFEIEESWETGHRLYFGISHQGEGFGVRLSFDRTTLEGRRYLREGRRAGACNALNGSLGVQLKEFRCNLRGRVESYTASNTGAVFWLQRRNFWLDGDRLSFGHLPFLKSRSVYEVGLELQRGGEAGYTYGREFYFSFLHRGDQGDPHRGVVELLLEKWFRIGSRLDQMLDIRCISYRHSRWTGKRNFVDVFAALFCRITDSSWCSVGIGLNPYSFDRWLYRFSDHGREDYLMERGVLRVIDSADEAELMDSLKEAETSLSEEWMITFEAGLEF